MHGWQNLWDYKLWVSWFQKIFFKVFPYSKSIEAYDSMWIGGEGSEIIRKCSHPIDTKGP